MCKVTDAEKRQLLNTNTILFKERTDNSWENLDLSQGIMHATGTEIKRHFSPMFVVAKSYGELFIPTLNSC